MNIPYADLRRIYQRYQDRIDKSIAQCIDNSDFINSNAGIALEKALSQQLNQTVVGVGSGTAAAQLALLAFDIGAGDEVIVPSMTFFSTAETVSQTGATPVFCDITMDDYCIDVDRIEQLITKRTRAIMPVDLYGQQANLSRIREICDRYNLRLIQDSAQSWGSKHHNFATGKFADAAIYSFYPGKNFDCMGDAGAISSNNSKFISKVQQLRNHGRYEKYVHNCIGWNHRLDGIQASVLLAKLPGVEEMNLSRQQSAAFYLDAFKNLPIKLPSTQSYNTHVWNQFVILVKKRDEFRLHLETAGIQTGMQFPLGCHQQPAYATSNELKLTNTETVADTCVSLPVFPFMTDQELEYVAETVSGYFS